jgi:hypothetical protein
MLSKRWQTKPMESQILRGHYSKGQNWNKAYCDQDPCPLKWKKHKDSKIVTKNGLIQVTMGSKVFIRVLSPGVN